MSVVCASHGLTCHCSFLSLSLCFSLSCSVYFFPTAPWDYNETGSLVATGSAFNLPAVCITAVLTYILIRGRIAVSFLAPSPCVFYLRDPSVRAAACSNLTVVVQQKMHAMC